MFERRFVSLSLPLQVIFGRALLLLLRLLLLGRLPPHLPSLFFITVFPVSFTARSGRGRKQVRWAAWFGDTFGAGVSHNDYFSPK